MSKIIILGTQGAVGLAQPLLDYFGERISLEPDWRPSTLTAHNPDLIITFDEGKLERGLSVAEMNRRGIATLLLMDGIPEWRNTWSRTADPTKRPLNQPVLSHKVGCLGNADARLYESWGNMGKCEIVGTPRLDHLIAKNKKIRVGPVRGRTFRLLIMTAKTPGFDQEQIDTTLRSLIDLRDKLSGRDDIELVWRLTKRLHKELGVKNVFTNATGMEFHNLLEYVDAVITTPSTAMLEAMLFGHPVALLDYHNCPHYIPAAWRIQCNQHIESVVEELIICPLNRMLYQDFCLHDALSCHSPALPRVIELIEEMIRLRKVARKNGSKAIEYPVNIVDQEESSSHWPSEEFSLEKLYPNHPVFGKKDLVTLQMELDAALSKIEQLKNQNDLLTQRLHGIPGYLTAKRFRKYIEKTFRN